MMRMPQFPNDHKFIKQIEAKIQPNRRFPFVQLKFLVEENDSAANDKPDFKCHLCSKKFIYQVQLTCHLKFQHSEVKKPFACSVCPDSYKTCKELKVHLGTQHADEFKLVIRGKKIFAKVKRHQCPHCQKKFSYAAVLTSHIVSHTNEKAYVCDVCDSKYKNNRGLQRHKLKNKCGQVIVLNLSKKFQCDQCEVAFGTKKCLQKHSSSFHGNNSQQRNFACLFCEYKAPNSSILQRHNRTHTEEKPFQCKDCHAAFANNSYLNVHVRSNCSTIKLTCPKSTRNTQSSVSKEENETLNAGSNLECKIEVDMDFNDVNLINPISSWVKSVTNSADVELASESIESDVIPTTVLKMEHC